MTNEEKFNIVSLILRLGLGLVFLYAAVASILTPSNWIGFYPEFLRETFSEGFLLKSFSTYEFILGVWLIWGRITLIPAWLALLTLIGIIGFNVASLDIVFRDVGLIFAAWALIVVERR